MSDDNALSFEQVLQHLQTAVEQLEAGGLPLDEAVALYERGMRLVAICGHHLDQAELRVVEIDTAVSGALGGDDPLDELPGRE